MKPTFPGRAYRRLFSSVNLVCDSHVASISTVQHDRHAASPPCLPLVAPARLGRTRAAAS